MYLKLEKRYSRRTQALVTYTYTRSNDNNLLDRYLDPFDLGRDWGPSSGERRHAVIASGSVLLPGEITLGAIWSWRSELPWSATAGRDLNGDGFNSDLVPGTTRNAGSRTLDLATVNAYRASQGLSPIDASQIDSSRINMVDVRASKDINLGGRVPPAGAGASVQPLQHEEPAGAVRGRAGRELAVPELRSHSHGASVTPARGRGEGQLVT